MAKESEKQIRSYIFENLKKELIGPGSEGIDGLSDENERISESPLQRYSLGILYPQKSLIVEYDADSEEELVPPEFQQNPEAENQRQDIKKEFDPPNQEDLSVNASNQYCPSTFGLSFIVEANTERINIKINTARYDKLVDTENEKNKTENAYIIISSQNEFLRNLEIDIFRIEEGRLFFNTTYNHQKHFQIINGLDNIQKQIFWTTYNKAKAFHYGQIFIRRPLSGIINVVLQEMGPNQVQEIKTSVDGLTVFLKKRLLGDKFKITITLSNSNQVTENQEKFSSPELAFFQCRLSVSIGTEEGSFREFENIHIGHSAESLDNLLYRNKKIFAVGHGCSVIWKGHNPREIVTDFMPIYEVPQTTFDLGNGSYKCLDVKYLANSSNPKEEVISDLKKFSLSYKGWVDSFDTEIQNLSEHLKETAINNKVHCNEALERINTGIELLSNKKVFDCFRLMNEAMMMQRYHTVNYVRTPRNVNDENFQNIPQNYFEQIPDNSFNWRPFQLAFILLSIDSIVNSDSEYRNVADLIWFPTGGGKTEAYLGVIAFTIFYRRMNQIENNFASSGGTAVIMRYTLRLLTAQQYQRASTLICACERLRELNPESLGEERITIGLWVGAANTPNTCQDAVHVINRHLIGQINISVENPFQLLYCPWCGTNMVDSANNENIGFIGNADIGELHYGFFVRCINQNCNFMNYLPLQVVDEEIYNKPTTLLLATADKFAMLAYKPETRSLFGLAHNYLPPELIIQDELHLISGPLGSIFGIYETMIDYLCRNNGIPPKIISSTATIKMADKQIMALFNRGSRLFPPPGINAEDSFFAKELPINENTYGRLYVGLMSIGMTQQTGQVRAMATLLYYNLKYYYDSTEFNDEERAALVDKYYSIVGYYNTIRELGIACSLLEDDISARFKQLVARKREIYPRPIWYKELTSRVESKEIPVILNDLENKKFFPTENIYNIEAIPVTLSSNMFSVGVDISRLNLMFMCGQPKTNAEYIQSSSRVGRADPGLVVVLFDGYRPRDRSHFENFQSFHQSFYRFVEPTSVTPFSLPARRRALHTLLIILCRLHFNQLSPLEFNRENIRNSFSDYLTDRVNNTSPNDLEMLQQELQNLITEWQNWIEQNQNNNVVFTRGILPANAGQRQRAAVALQIPLFSTYDSNDGLWKVLSSLRNVDIPTYCIMKEQ